MRHPQRGQSPDSQDGRCGQVPASHGGTKPERTTVIGVNATSRRVGPDACGARLACLGQPRTSEKAVLQFGDGPLFQLSHPLFADAETLTQALQRERLVAKPASTKNGPFAGRDGAQERSDFGPRLLFVIAMESSLLGIGFGRDQAVEWESSR